ncbi:PaaI family thioesterase [Bacillus spongiae]|uniref:PaaI family thioesterase n=1 Tax=Bacillus spongiae TaxID=2683610 RepID=A0ABU8HA58_9BACI
MKEKIQALVDQCLINASEEEQETLRSILDGFLKKKEKQNSTYIGGLMHMERELGEDFCEVTIPITPLTYNSLNMVHGGVTATLVDSAMGTIANYMLPKGYGAVTSNLQIHYLAPGIAGNLRATGEIIHKGKKTMMVEGKVYNDDQKVIAHSTASFFIIKAQS